MQRRSRPGRSMPKTAGHFEFGAARSFSGRLKNRAFLMVGTDRRAVHRDAPSSPIRHLGGPTRRRFGHPLSRGLKLRVAHAPRVLCPAPPPDTRRPPGFTSQCARRSRAESAGTPIPAREGACAYPAVSLRMRARLSEVLFPLCLFILTRRARRIEWAALRFFEHEHQLRQQP